MRALSAAARDRRRRGGDGGHALPRQLHLHAAGLYLGFGVATAVAVALGGWVPSLVFVQRNFQERLGLSIGIISSGVGVGMLLVVPLTQVLIDAFGWRVAFRVLGVIAVVWIVPSSLWLRRKFWVSARFSVTTQTQNQEDRVEPDSPNLREAART